MGVGQRSELQKESEGLSRDLRTFNPFRTQGKGESGRKAGGQNSPNLRRALFRKTEDKKVLEESFSITRREIRDSREKEKVLISHNNTEEIGGEGNVEEEQESLSIEKCDLSSKCVPRTA